MPGAPNRPPDRTDAAPPAPPAPTPPERLALRRLVPSHVALLQEVWKGAPAAELTQPFERAEAAYRAGDFVGAIAALDQLSSRFTEPRWPTLPLPFRELRVVIPAPEPPQWNPEHGLDVAEKERRRARRTAETQLALADGSVAWARAHGIAADDLAARLDRARAILGPTELPEGYYVEIDALWTDLAPRLPRPKRAPAAPSPPPAES